MARDFVFSLPPTSVYLTITGYLNPWLLRSFSSKTKSMKSQTIVMNNRDVLFRFSSGKGQQDIDHLVSWFSSDFHRVKANRI